MLIAPVMPLQGQPHIGGSSTPQHEATLRQAMSLMSRIRSDLIGLGDIPHAHQLQTSERIVHGTSRRYVRTVVREGLKTRSVQVGQHMTVLDRLLVPGQLADQFSRMRPGARNAKNDLDWGGWLVHLEHAPTFHKRIRLQGQGSNCANPPE
jgi:hypothetical protein